MKAINNKIIITMPELMEQMDISDKTLHRMIVEGDLPDFTYGSRASKKKGWHAAVLERHAMEKYEQSQSIKDSCNIAQVRRKDMTVVPLGRSHAAVTHQQTDLDNGNPIKQKLGRKEMPKGVNRSARKSRVAAGFADFGA